MVRLWTHRVFVVLAVLFSISFPIQVIRAFLQAPPPNGNAANVAGGVIGGTIGMFAAFFIYLCILIPLVLIAVFTKPPKRS